MRWNSQHQESAQRDTAHVVNAGSRLETKIYLRRMLNTARELGFEMLMTKILATYQE